MQQGNIFSDLPDDARCWVYVADEPLAESTVEALRSRAQSFLGTWQSHGRTVIGAMEVLDKQIVLLAANVEGGDISGCGIDKSVHMVEQAARELGISWLPALRIVYRDADGHVQHCSRSEFKARVEDATVTSNTHVFDPTVQSVGDVREGQLEQPARQSWHSTVFDLTDSVPA